MRLIFLNRYFFPDQAPTSVLLTDIAFALHERGIAVTVITSRLGYESGERLLPANEIMRGVEVRRVWSSKRGRSGIVGRAIEYASFYAAAGWQLWRITRGTDVIVAKTDPPLISVMAAVVARLRGARLVNWLQDIFPEVAETLEVGGGAGKRLLGMLKGPRNWSLRSANCNVVVGKLMTEHLESEGIPATKIRVIANWADGELITPLETARNELRKNWFPADPFVVAYAGNLGRAHDVATIIKAMTLLNEQAKASATADVSQRIRFVLVGGGAQFATIEREVSRRELTNVQFHAYQPRARLNEVLGMADVHLASLHPQLEGLIVPSKFYGIAAAGRPILFIGATDGEIARLIAEANCGFAVSEGDVKALVGRIRQLAESLELRTQLGSRARKVFEAQWDKRYGVDQWTQLLIAETQADRQDAKYACP